MTKFTIHGAPRGKGRPRFVRKTGRAYTDEKTASYEALVQLAYQRVAGDGSFTDAVRMEIDVYHAVPRSDSKRRRAEKLRSPAVHKPDADNVAKIICDALNRVAYRDDTQVTTLIVRKHYADLARVDVRIDAEAFEVEGGITT